MSPASSKAACSTKLAVAGAMGLAALPALAHGAGGVCPGGSPTLGRITRIAPKCFDTEHCHSLCDPVGELLSEYLRDRDRGAVQAKVCANKGVFQCVFQAGNVEPCAKVLAAGRAIGANLPSSSEELDKLCGHRLLSSAVCPGVNPMVSIVTDYAPECFSSSACAEVCGPLGSLVDQFLAGSDTDAVKEAVCANPDPFRCLVQQDNAEKCSKVLAAGSSLGVALPTTDAELDEQCGVDGNSTEEHRDVGADDDLSLGARSSTAGATLAAALVAPLLAAL